MSELAAKDPAERVEMLIELTERLTGLIDKETGLFEANRPGEARAFQDEKQQLANIYRKETARIAQDASLVAEAPGERRHHLAALTDTMYAAVDRNRHAADALRAVTEGVVRAVADEVARTRTPDSYGPGSGAKTGSYSSSAITLNRSV